MKTNYLKKAIHSTSKFYRLGLRKFFDRCGLHDIESNPTLVVKPVDEYSKANDSKCIAMYFDVDDVLVAICDGNSLYRERSHYSGNRKVMSTPTYALNTFVHDVDSSGYRTSLTEAKIRRRHIIDQGKATKMVLLCRRDELRSSPHYVRDQPFNPRTNTYDARKALADRLDKYRADKYSKLTPDQIKQMFIETVNSLTPMMFDVVDNMNMDATFGVSTGFDRNLMGVMRAVTNLAKSYQGQVMELNIRINSSGGVYGHPSVDEAKARLKSVNAEAYTTLRKIKKGIKTIHITRL